MKKLFYLSFIFMTFFLLNSCGDSSLTEEEELQEEKDSKIAEEQMTQTGEPIPSTPGATIPELNVQSEHVNRGEGVSHTCTKGSQTKTYVLYKYPQRSAEGLLCHLDLPGDDYFEARNEPNFCDEKLQQTLQRNQQAGFVCSDN